MTQSVTLCVCVCDVTLLISLTSACCICWTTLRGSWRTCCRDAAPRTHKMDGGWPAIGCPSSRWARPWRLTPPIMCQCHQQDVKIVPVTYPLKQGGHVIAKESQIHLLVFILWENKLNEVVCFYLNGSNDQPCWQWRPVVCTCKGGLTVCFWESVLFCLQSGGGMCCAFVSGSLHRWRHAGTQQVQC